MKASWDGEERLGDRERKRERGADTERDRDIKRAKRLIEAISRVAVHQCLSTDRQ